MKLKVSLIKLYLVTICKSMKQLPLLLIITGLAGSGKSYVIDALKNLLQNSCKVCAYFGIAAFNVKGQTIHSLLQLPIREKVF